MQYLILKIKDNITDLDALTERATGSWKINPARLQKVEPIVITYHNKIVAYGRLGRHICYDRLTHRCILQVKKLTTDNPLVGKILNYKTMNPCTTLSEEKFKEYLNRR